MGGIRQAEVCFVTPSLATAVPSDLGETLAAAREVSTKSLEECRRSGVPAYVIPLDDIASDLTCSSATALRSDLDLDKPQYLPGYDGQMNAQRQQRGQPQRQQQQQPKRQPQRQPHRQRVGRGRGRKRRIPLKLACQLEELESEDAACVLSVRKIQKLGFESAQLLAEHYSKYGAVKRVLVSNSHEKTPPTPELRTRMRPSGLGFVVMRSREDAAAALAEGDIQNIAGIAIEVREFMHRRDFYSETNPVDDDLDDYDSNSLTSGTRCSTDSSELWSL